MKHRTTSHFIEVKEDGVVKVVPHNNTGGYKFMEKKKAKQFLEQVRTNNPDVEFRLASETVEIEKCEWGKA